MHRAFLFALAICYCVWLLPEARWHTNGQTELFQYSGYEVATVHRGEVRALAFDDAGKRLASAGKDGLILIRDVAGKQIIKRLPGHSKSVNALAFRRDGRYLASASDDKTVRLWDLQTGNSQTLPHGGKVTTVAFNPSGDALATGGEDRLVMLWSVETARNLGSHAEHKKGVKSVFFARDESLYSVGEDRRVIEWDVKGKRVLRSWEDTSELVNAVAVAGDWLMVGAENMALPKGMTRIDDTRPTEAVRKNYVKVYGLATGGLQKDFDFGSSVVVGLSISADYNYLAAIRGNVSKSSVVIYDIKRGEQVAIIEQPNKEKMTSLIFSPNGQWLVSGNEVGTLNIWRIEGVSPAVAEKPPDLRGRKNVFTTSREPLLAFNRMMPIAILDLDAIGVEQSLAQSVSEQVRARVAGAPNLRLIERQRIEKVLSEIKFQQSGNTDPVTAARIGKMLNISKIAFGSLSRLGKNLIVTVQLVDVQTAAIDGIRQIVCNNCANEELLETAAVMQPALVARDAPTPIYDASVAAAPSIKLASPKEGEQVTHGEVTLRGTINDNIGLTGLKISLSSETRDLALPPPASGAQEFNFREPLKAYSLNHPITLAPGSNVITITARNSNGLTEELKRVVYYETSETSLNNRPIGKRWAFVVGISAYQDSRINQLRFAHRDAEDVAKFLQTSNGGGYRPESIILLTNAQATWEKIRTELRNFARKPEREDLVTIYFAAHGTQDPKQPGNVYLVTHNTQIEKLFGTALSVNEIELALRENLRAQRVVFFADTCYSGAFQGDIGARLLVQRADAINLAFNEAIRRSKPGAFIFTSALGNEVSKEGEKWGGGHGVFTWHLLQGLKGKADIDNDGKVTTEEVFNYVYQNVERDTGGSQHPTLLSSKYDPKLPLAILSPQSGGNQTESVDPRGGEPASRGQISTPQSTQGRGGWTLQIGSFDQIAEARKHVARLQTMHIEARIVKARIAGGAIRYRVHVGRFTNPEETDRYGKQLLVNGAIQEFIATRYQTQ